MIPPLAAPEIPLRALFPAPIWLEYEIRKICIPSKFSSISQFCSNSRLWIPPIPLVFLHPEISRSLCRQGWNTPIYYSTRKNSEKVCNEFFQIGSKQIKTGLVNWSKKIKSKTHFEAITTHPFCISAARLYCLPSSNTNQTFEIFDFGQWNLTMAIYRSKRHTR